jgi:ESF2/ABP1 family protein
MEEPSTKPKGVCYISRIPPHMQVIRLREMLECYGIERVYLKPRNPEQKPSKKTV